MSEPAHNTEHKMPVRLQPLVAKKATLPGSASLGRLIGRETEVVAICESLSNADTRLLTLIGPGGVGKTRLALHVGATLQSEFSDGTTFVYLDQTNNPRRVIREIAQAIGIQDRGDISIDVQLKNWLRSQEMLLVLDNFEQVIEAAPEIGNILLSCPGITILVTSRSRLGLYGERLFAVEPLATGNQDEIEKPAEHELAAASRLFVDRVQGLGIDLELTPENRLAVNDICRQLDGLPLAIELAAARFTVLSLDDLRTRLKPGLNLLTTAAPAVPDRWHTMSSAIAWSYDLLDRDLQRLFRRLAVFTNGFSLEAAASMSSTEEDVHLLDMMASLVSSSLMVSGESIAGDRRFHMLQTIREFGIEKLIEHGELEATRSEHLAWVVSFTETVQRKMMGMTQRDALHRMDAEQGNIEAGLSHALATGDANSGLRICYGLWLYWNTGGKALVGAEWTTRFLDLNAATSDYLLAAGHFTQGILYSHTGHLKEGLAAGERALEIATRVGDPILLGLIMYLHGLIANSSQNWVRAEVALEEAQQYFRDAEQFTGEAAVINDLGRTAYLQGDLDLARERFDRALEISREFKMPRSTAMSLHNCANVETDQGDLRDAARMNLESLAISRENGDDWHIVLPLIGLVRVAAESGNVLLAARLTGVAESLVDQPGQSLWDWQIPVDYARTLEATRSILSNERLQAAISDGRRLSLYEAINESKILASHDVASERTVQLTARERDVLLLVAQGLADREIGDALFISHRTAQTHISSVYRKLGVHTRPDAIAEAERLGLLLNS